MVNMCAKNATLHTIQPQSICYICAEERRNKNVDKLKRFFFHSTRCNCRIYSYLHQDNSAAGKRERKRDREINPVSPLNEVAVLFCALAFVHKRVNFQKLFCMEISIV